jgi:calcineurin-like phosphoesterase family protein
MTIWFTSDLHFHHRNIVKFTNRGKDTTQELHDEWLVNLWNSQVAKGDLVYHLGDFSFAKDFENIRSLCRRLSGNKYMLRGNHDYHFDLYHALAGVTALRDYKEIKLDGIKTVLFHYPIASWHSQSHGSMHLHGHCHGNLKQEFSQGKILDVSLDSAYMITGQHRFFSAEDVLAIMQGKQKVINDLHRENL